MIFFQTTQPSIVSAVLRELQKTAPLFTRLCPYTRYLLASSMKGLSTCPLLFPCASADSSDLPFPCLDSKNTHKHSPWSSLLAWVLFTTPSQICNGVSPILALVWPPSLVQFEWCFWNMHVHTDPQDLVERHILTHYFWDGAQGSAF